MDAVTRDLNRHLNAIDDREAFEETIESELEQIEAHIQEQIEDHKPVVITGFGVLTLGSFLSFLTLEEFHPMQGYRWLAVKQLVHDCNNDNEHARLSGWDVINYASKRGYCRG
ncbi:hypothetical protein [Endozoicomonas sp. SCSIO W0465]|uniref:hypothetical protein n=1 Tax=Endozoicomonas TaxID=305899 RepID=UPI002076111A|nr:hypothetical protein [Endozoicomonas sp. SCSIO W0465]USE35903.1 hypothetical protein MJO57_28210 [Endozoicomonas sp. SCSIO W0465]